MNAARSASAAKTRAMYGRAVIAFALAIWLRRFGEGGGEEEGGEVK